MTVIKLPRNKMTERLSMARSNSIDISELIGLCRGVLADGTINFAEAEFILQWFNERSRVLEAWPADELHKLLCTVVENGTLSEDEETELSELLEEMIGDPVAILIF